MPAGGETPGASAATTGGGGLVAGFVATARPRQWIKNLFVLAPIVFLGPLLEPSRVVAAFVAFGAFCAMASASYILNDLFDRERDRAHPTKRLRPIASGRLPLGVAGAGAIVLGGGALAAALTLGSSIAMLLAAYAAMNVAYSVWLKHVVIVDVFVIAIGFVLRVAVGSLATGVPPSAWILIATFLLALFLALSKRRHELTLLGAGSDQHRPVLGSYSIALLDELISVVTPATLLTYILYTLEPGLVERFGTEHLYLSSIFVAFGVFRYLYLVHQKEVGGSPTDAVLADGPLAVGIAGWLLCLVAMIYL